MSFWYDVKNKNYSSNGKGSWLRAYTDRVVSVLRNECRKKFSGHVTGQADRHKAADIDCVDGSTVEQNFEAYKGSGENSFVANNPKANSALTDNSVVSGINNISGAKGYYYKAIDFANNAVYLSKEQVIPEVSTIDIIDASFGETGYSVGDEVSIVNGNHYDFCSTIEEVNNNKIILSSIPFGSISSVVSSDNDDWSLYVPLKPNPDNQYAKAIFRGCYAEGENNIAAGLQAHTEGYSNIAAGNYSHTEGRNNIAVYAAHSEGKGNKALGAYSHVEGGASESSGEYSHAEGLGTKASGLTAHAEGNGSNATGTNSHAEGSKTTASGVNSHAEGQSTTASGEQSHSEGMSTVASGYRSHAEGWSSQATAAAAHSEGKECTASGAVAHAEGLGTQAMSEAAHSEGKNTSAIGIGAHAEGVGTIANGGRQHVQGKYNIADTSSAHIIGNGSSDSSRSNAHTVDWNGNAWYAGSVMVGNDKKPLAVLDEIPVKYMEGQTVAPENEGETKVASEGATVIGDLRERKYFYTDIEEGNIASGYYATAMGYGTTASGRAAVSMGTNVVASGDESLASGSRIVASGENSFAKGWDINVRGDYSLGIGTVVNVSGQYSCAIGYALNANGNHSVAMGIGTETKDYNTVIGKYNFAPAAGTEDGKTGDAFVIGNGSFDNPSNALRVRYSGNVYGAGAYNSTGADIAELYEWQDGNPDNEDRRGLFVTLDGKNIRLANSDDTYIKGVISSAPCLIGDSYEDSWQGKYLTDIFGKKLTQIVHIDAKYEEREVTDMETGEKKTEKILIHEAYDAEEWVLNPEYDPEREYVSRRERPEYDYVSSWGKLVLTDDGTCEINGFAKPGDAGIATKSDTQTSYRVMERLDENHIYVAVG